MIVSFSGIDGSGKSTQISALQSWLVRGGSRVSVLSMWDDVVVFSRLRESMSHRTFGGDQGVGSPEKPLERRDKNVTSPVLSVMRCGLYFADAISLAFKVWLIERDSPGIVIFDRYIYDELANLPVESRATRAFIRALIRIVPKPDLAYLVDASPEAARARKPEYPLDFLHRNRRSYLAIARVAEMIVIDNNSIEETQGYIRRTLLPAVEKRGSESLSYTCGHDG